jgi:methylenetetrahydrofolate reductase (NADPH)
VVPDGLLKKVEQEWRDKKQGRKAAVERAARLGVILKGLGYKGIHIGGVHRSFKIAAAILDRMDAIGEQWRDFLPEFDEPMENGYYVYTRNAMLDNTFEREAKKKTAITLYDKTTFKIFNKVHDLFFDFTSPVAPVLKTLAKTLDKNRAGRLLVRLIEDPFKMLLLSCQRCGDCGIQHLAFQCPESGCPKHTRNGACGGSLKGMCEVRPDQQCVWVRAYHRWSTNGSTDRMFSECVPPRMWELDGTSSWLNFHLGRDHQTASTEVTQLCQAATCKLESL